MKIFVIISLLMSQLAWTRGQLLLIGGGNRSEAILMRMIQLGKGNILIIPLASEIPQEVAASAKKQLETLGARQIQVWNCQDTKLDDSKCLEQIQQAGLIYFTGGSQSKLLKALENTPALKLILSRFQQDLSLAGTSAGTAIMSEIMLTGNPLAPHTSFDGIKARMVETTAGWGLVKKMILDQHFLKRSRQNRLMSATFDNPHLIGVGIDESTAILVDADENFEVLGDSSVMIIDARSAKIQLQANEHYHSENVKIHLLTHGQKFKISSKK